MQEIFGVFVRSGAFADLRTLAKVLKGPKYNGKYLHNLLRENLKETKLHQTLTNVVITSFDIARLQPVIFSSYKVDISFLFCFLS